MWQFISAHTDTGSSYTRSLLNHINNCIPWLDKNRGGKYHRLKKYPHTAAQMSRELAGKGIWQETLLKVQLLWIRLPPRLLPPSLPPIFLPHADSRLIVTNDYSVRKPSFHLHESFQRLSQWHVSVNAGNHCIAALKGLLKQQKKKERKLVVNIQCRLHKRPFLTCFPLVRHFRIFGSMTSSRKSMR